MRVLSVDPGYERVGIAVLEKKARAREVLLFSTCVETRSQEPFEKRLKLIGREFEHVIKEFAPIVVAVEKLYFQNNQKTAMNVAEARGMIRYIAAMHDLPVYEYTPLQIKAAVSGDGHASKDQVVKMVSHLLKVEKQIRFDDEYDAIAVGITCLASISSKNIHNFSTP